MPRFYRNRRFWLILVVVVIAAAGVAAFLAFGPPQLFAKSESPEFCASCHAMESEYEAWFHAGAHKRIRCVECHLPNDNILHHLARKGTDGGWDFLTFHTGLYPGDIRLSEGGAKILKANCLRCHAETMARVNEDRDCWFCHRQLRHRQTGVVATLPVPPQP